MFAQVPVPAPNPKGVFQSAEFYITVGVFIAVLLFGALVIHFLDRWRKRDETAAGALRESTLDLTSYREMYENGEITQSEYERIRDKLAAKMKHEVGRPEPATAPPAAHPPPPPESPEPPPPAGPPPSPVGG